MPTDESAAGKAQGRIDFMARRRARALVLQGLYQYQIARTATGDIRLHLMESPNYARCDEAYFDALWRGVAEHYEALRAQLEPHLARDMQSLSPVEAAILILGAWELTHRLEIPYRIIINEAIDLAKAYGGTDGHKFVNGVLDKLALQLRADEIRATRAAAGKTQKTEKES